MKATFALIDVIKMLLSQSNKTLPMCLLKFDKI